MKYSTYEMTLYSFENAPSKSVLGASWNEPNPVSRNNLWDDIQNHLKSQDDGSCVIFISNPRPKLMKNISFVLSVKDGVNLARDGQRGREGGYSISSWANI